MAQHRGDHAQLLLGDMLHVQQVGIFHVLEISTHGTHHLEQIRALRNARVSQALLRLLGLGTDVLSQRAHDLIDPGHGAFLVIAAKDVLALRPVILAPDQLKLQRILHRGGRAVAGGEVDRAFRLSALLLHVRQPIVLAQPLDLEPPCLELFVLLAFLVHPARVDHLAHAFLGSSGLPGAAISPAAISPAAATLRRKLVKRFADLRDLVLREEARGKVARVVPVEARRPGGEQPLDQHRLTR